MGVFARYLMDRDFVRGVPVASSLLPCEGGLSVTGDGYQCRIQGMSMPSCWQSSIVAG